MHAHGFKQRQRGPHRHVVRPAQHLVRDDALLWQQANTAVSNALLYPQDLVVIGVQHPGRNEVIAAQENDWRMVTETQIGPAPVGRNFVSDRA